jgi:hypothetical protein
LSDVAAGLRGRCLKKEHCSQVGATLSRRPKRSHEQSEVWAPFHFAQRLNIDRMHSLVLSDHRTTVQMTADELQIRKTSVYTILTEDLEIRKICAKTVPKLLTSEKKLRRKQYCIDWKALEERDAFLERVITGDESWIYPNRQRCSKI